MKRNILLKTAGAIYIIEGLITVLTGVLGMILGAVAANTLSDIVVGFVPMARAFGSFAGITLATSVFLHGVVMFAFGICGIKSRRKSILVVIGFICTAWSALYVPKLLSIGLAETGITPVVAVVIALFYLIGSVESSTTKKEELY